MTKSSSTGNSVPSRAALGAAARIMQRCDELARFSSMADGVCRVYLSPEHAQANARVSDWMVAAGMDVHVDAAGNVRGRLEGTVADAPALVIGSHLDSIPDAGKYDGILGVLLGIDAVERINASGNRLPFALEVIGFGEEEGVRFGTTLMTSRACAGSWDEQWWTLQDESGQTLRDAFKDFGLNPAAIQSARMNPQKVLAFVEAHIEQGPVLESRGLPLGVVSAIAGAKRLQLAITGMAGHAGTTPMALRKDALVAAALGVALAEQLATQHGVVATVGQINCTPGGVNVIPGAAEFSLDIRSGDDGLRDQVLGEFETGLHSICEQRGLELSVQTTHQAAAVACAEPLQAMFAKAVKGAGGEVHALESGAGHDAMAMAEICDVAMLFIRCEGGISHNPAEAITVEDAASALDALVGFIETFEQEAKE